MPRDSEGLSETLRAFLVHYMPSMDHVAVLLAVRHDAASTHHVTGLSVKTSLEAHVIERVVRELTASGLLQKDGAGYRYAPTEEVARVVDQLADMYQTRPVTLVRALYDRPPRAIQSFADAFRVRPEGD